MREARIILPVVADLPFWVREISAFETYLVERWGGFTRTKDKGAWLSNGQDSREDVVIYDIAVEAGPGNEDDKVLSDLYWVARSTAKRLNQEAVYLRYPNGEVVIIGLCDKPREPDPADDNRDPGNRWDVI